MSSLSFCSAGLPTDITVEVEEKVTHLHKFPLLSKCGKIAKLLESCPTDEGNKSYIVLSGFPGGSVAFEIAAKFCYGKKVELTPSNIGSIYCAAYFLEMTDEYGEGNLLSKAETFLHKVVLPSWKNCVQALKSCEPVLLQAEQLNIMRKCCHALSVMACTDPSLFGWPMMLYGSLQSPGGSILWNGINTGARVRSSYSDWWYDDLTDLNVSVFERVIRAMETKGIRPENRAGAIVHYAKRYLPGLNRRQNDRTRRIRSSRIHLGSTSAVADPKSLLETLVQLLPCKKCVVSCKVLFRLLRSAILLNASHSCKDSLEKRIGLQLEFATLDGLLVPNYSDDIETLYDTDCALRIIKYFVSSDHENIQKFSPPMEVDSILGSPSEDPVRRVAKLVDDYLTEVAPDTNLKPFKILSLGQTLPASVRPLNDGLYRALDIYFKTHPWLSDTEKEELFQIIDCRKLSMEACSHAAQNERLPLRIVIQVLFFEQLQLRSAIAGCFQVADQDVDHSNPDANSARNEIMPQITVPAVQRGNLAPVIHQNRVLKVDMDNIKSRVGELEQQFSFIRHEIERIGKLKGAFGSLSVALSKTIGCAPAKFNRQKSGASFPTRSSIALGHKDSSSKSVTRRQHKVQHADMQVTKHKRSFSIF